MHEYMHIVKLKMTVSLWVICRRRRFYFSLVTFVVFNVPISTDFYLCVKGGIT